MKRGTPRTSSALEAHLGYWMRFVSNHVLHAFRLKVESHGVTMAEWVVMRALFEEDARHFKKGKPPPSKRTLTMSAAKPTCR